MRFRLASLRAGLAASTAREVSSATGGIGLATARKEVAKIAPLDRTAVGCKRPHWVLLKAHQERLGAPEPLGYIGDTVEYLLRTTGINNSVHYWVDGDTACKMWSSNGITKKHKFSIVADPQGHFLCGLCHQAMPMANAPDRRPPKTIEQKKLKAQRKAAKKRAQQKTPTGKKSKVKTFIGLSRQCSVIGFSAKLRMAARPHGSPEKVRAHMPVLRSFTRNGCRNER